MEALQWFMGLGSSVVLPVFVFVFGLVLGAKPDRAFKSGLTVGVGFIGLNLVLDLLAGSLGPAAQAMVTNFGLSLNTLDVGWPASSAIAFGSTLGSLAIPIGIGVNLILLFLGVTKTLNVDLWNYWHIAFTGSMVFALTNDFALGLITMVSHLLLLVFLGDLIAPKVQEFYNFPNITFPHGTSAPSYLVALPLNWVFDRIPGFNKLQADPETIQKRFGIFGDSTVMGVIIGLVIGFLAGYKVDVILQLAMKTGAVMMLMPRMVALLMEGLTPISEAANVFIKKRFPHRDLYIGMDSAISVGHPAVLATSLLMVPITLFLAIVVPGNTVLPFVDLATIPFIVCLMVPVFKGNIVRSVVAASIYMSVGLLIATWAAPMITQAAINASFDLGGNTSISSLVDGAIWTTFVFAGSAKLAIPWIGSVGVGLASLVGLVKLNKTKRKS